MKGEINMVDVKLKKAYIRSILKENDLKSLDGREFLKYLLKDNEALENIKFVTYFFYETYLKKAGNVRAICLYADGSENMSEHVMYGEFEKNETHSFYCDVVTYPLNETFVAIKFKLSNYTSLLNKSVLEDDVKRFSTKREEKIFTTCTYGRPKKVEYDGEFACYVDEIIEKSIKNYKIEKIKKEIDNALDNKDIQSFNKLTKELESLYETV